MFALQLLFMVATDPRWPFLRATLITVSLFTPIMFVASLLMKKYPEQPELVFEEEQPDEDLVADERIEVEE